METIPSQLASTSLQQPQVGPSKNRMATNHCINRRPSFSVGFCKESATLRDGSSVSIGWFITYKWSLPVLQIHCRIAWRSLMDWFVEPHLAMVNWEFRQASKMKDLRKVTVCTRACLLRCRKQHGALNQQILVHQWICIRKYTLNLCIMHVLLYIHHL